MIDLTTIITLLGPAVVVFVLDAIVRHVRRGRRAEPRHTRRGAMSTPASSGIPVPSSTPVPSGTPVPPSAYELADAEVQPERRRVA